MAKKILVVLTSVDKIPSTDKSIGWYLGEFAHPHHVLASRGATFKTASPHGGVAPVDPSSVKQTLDDSVCVAFLRDQKPLYESTATLAELDPAETAETYDAIFYPGGHGPIFDLVSDEHSKRLIQEFAGRGKPVAAVCHGSAVLLEATLPDGTPLLAGKQVTGFSNAEEIAIKLMDLMPYALETRLQEVSEPGGGGYVKADENWAPKVVVQGNLITGQNPASAKGVGEALAELLGI